MPKMPPMTKLIWLDCETTGLSPTSGHAPYEIAMVDQAGAEVVLWVQLSPEQLAAADATALRIGRYWERGPRPSIRLNAEFADSLADLAAQEQPIQCSEQVAAWIVVRMTAGAHLVGAAPSFDAAMLEAMARRHQLVPAWHYHLVDVEALVAGAYGIALPWDSAELSRKADVDPEQFDRHTALGDARWSKAIYDAVMAP
jgi:oligoribonuclease (3'-5' exoribonuclease)